MVEYISPFSEISCKGQTEVPHNGVFKTLFEVVAFYNTRDVALWPSPEVPENVNTDEFGDLGLTNQEMEDIVAFMMTLTDGWDPMQATVLPE